MNLLNRNITLAIRRDDARRITATLLAALALGAATMKGASCDSCPGARVAVSTNMLYDAATVPNLGVELYLCYGWSVHANWAYAWWKSDRHGRCLRYNGGEIAARRWFGPMRLSGHHVGLYAQVMQYQVEWNHHGYLSGRPGGDLTQLPSYAFGLEYGYSLPVSTRFNIDFSIGLGYQGGQYNKYRTDDGCKAWETTRLRHWVGPTKASISLVWHLGARANNKKNAQ